MEKNKKENAAHNELCVLCSQKTEYTPQTPVSARKGYVEGAGQLCPDCYAAVYGKGQGCHG